MERVYLTVCVSYALTRNLSLDEFVCHNYFKIVQILFSTILTRVPLSTSLDTLTLLAGIKSVRPSHYSTGASATFEQVIS